MNGQEVTAENKWWQTCPRKAVGIWSFVNLVIGERVEMAAGGQENHSQVVAARGDIIPSQPGPVRTWLCASEARRCPHAPSPAFYDKNWVVYILLLNTFVKLLLIAGGKNPVKHSLIWVSGECGVWMPEMLAD